MFDTILIKRSFNYQKILECISSHLGGDIHNDISKLADEYWIKFMQDRNETCTEASFKHQLTYYGERTGREYDISISDLEWKCLKVSHKDEIAAGAIETMSELKTMGFVIGIVSNSMFSSETLSRYVESFGLGHCIDVIVSSASFGKRKPSPEIFEYICKLFEIVPDSNILFIGNNPAKDARGALNAGLTPVILGDSADSPNIMTIKELSDLIKILR